MSNTKVIVLVIIWMIAGNPVPAQQFTRLRVGDAAPPLTILEWIKGKPVPVLEKGKIYVVEFSGVACPPCRLAIPHLTEMAKEYAGKVSFVSVYTRESNKEDAKDLSYVGRIKELVTKMGAKMDFPVAADVPQQITGDAWGLSAVPIAFIVDETGKLAWIGNPLVDLDVAIGQVVAGTLAVDKVAKAQNEYYECIDNILEIKAKGDYLVALKKVDSLLKIHPKDIGLYRIKFQVLAGNDDKSANAWMRWMLGTGTDYDWVHVINDVAVLPKEPDYELATEVADRAISAATTNDFKAALFEQKANIYFGSSSKRTNPEDARKELEKALNVFKEGVKFCASNKVTFDQEERYNGYIYNCQYKIWAGTDDKKANALVQQLLKEKPKYMDWYWLLDDMLKVPAQPSYDLALRVADQAIAATPNKMRVLSILGKKAGIYITKGDTKKALKIYEEAVADIKTGGNQEIIDIYEKKLNDFKEKNGIN